MSKKVSVETYLYRWRKDVVTYFYSRDSHVRVARRIRLACRLDKGRDLFKMIVILCEEAVKDEYFGGEVIALLARCKKLNEICSAYLCWPGEVPTVAQEMGSYLAQAIVRTKRTVDEKVSLLECLFSVNNQQKTQWGVISALQYMFLDHESAEEMLARIFYGPNLGS